MEKRVTLMIAVMIGAFLVAWTPYSMMALIETLNGDDYVTQNESIIISPAVATVPSLFAKTSAVLNPLIYGMLNTQVMSSLPLIISNEQSCIHVRF